MCAPNLIFPAVIANNQVPGFWVRDDRFNLRYVKGANSNLGNFGGAEAHTHTSPLHLHSLGAHVHTGALGSPTGGGYGSAPYNSAHPLTTTTHGHTFTTSTSSGGNTDETTVTYGSCSNDPPFFTVIFIKSLSYGKIPKGALVLRQTARVGLSYHSASEGRFLKGAESGKDAGEIGGSLINVHDISHTHNVNSHSHPPFYTNGTGITGGGITSNWSGGSYAANSHYHLLTINDSTQNIDSYQGSLTTLEEIEPLHKTVKHFIADNETLLKPGDIAMTTETKNPIGWVTCDGTQGTPDLIGFFVKNENSEVVQGGSNAHSHAAQSHQHAAPDSHAHTWAAFSNGYGTFYTASDPSGQVVGTVREHTHPAGTTSSVEATYNVASTSADLAQNEPLYISVRFIMATKAALGGAALIQGNFL